VIRPAYRQMNWEMSIIDRRWSKDLRAKWENFQMCALSFTMFRSCELPAIIEEILIFFGREFLKVLAPTLSSNLFTSVASYAKWTNRSNTRIV